MGTIKLVFDRFLLRICLLLCVCTSFHAYGQTYVDQRIEYINKDAAEVYLVWGIDGWKTVPPEFYADHTVISKEKLHTKMTASDSVFTATVKVPEGSAFDFMFWVAKNRKGEITDQWDIPAVRQRKISANSNKIVVHSNQLHEKPNPLRPIFMSGIVQLVLLLSGVILLLLKFTPSKFKSGYSTFIALTAVSAYCIIFFLRWRQNGPSSGILATMSSTLYDSMLIAGMAFVFLALGLIKRTRQRVLSAGFAAVSAILVIISILNAGIVSKLGQPLNYQWLYYSDFLGSTEAQTAIMANLNTAELIRSIGLFIVFGLLAVLGILLFSLLRKSVIPASIVAMAIILIPISGRLIYQGKLTTAQEANPILYFSRSLWHDVGESNLFTMNIPSTSLVNSAKPLPLEASPIRNVIVVVLESAAAQYFDIYGGNFALSPNLNEAMKRGMVFENMYAHAPATNKSMVALLCSMYPWISYNTLTQEYPELSQSSISGEFKKAGFRTAFLTSADLGFQNSEIFVKAREFDKVDQHLDISCDRHFKMKGFGKGFGIGVDDMCLGSSLFNWLDAEPDSRSFSVLWTNQAHYPYFFEGEERDFDVNNIYFNRYLNTIQHYDELIGSLIDGLTSRNMMDSTLIAIVGDHGEAFGQHNQTGHGHNVYEENLHVPMVLINPLLFSGERTARVSGHIDLPPTLLQLAGLEVPSDWQGSSMFGENREESTFFFTPWSDYLFGGRFGKYKVIFNETTGDIQLYDLANDPGEQVDLSQVSADRIEEYRKQVAAWVQAQQLLIENKIKSTPEPY